MGLRWTARGAKLSGLAHGECSLPAFGRQCCATMKVGDIVLPFSAADCCAGSESITTITWPGRIHL